MEYSEHKKEIKAYYNKVADKRNDWIEKNQYYHDSVLSYLRFVIPTGKKVLVLGSSVGFILNGLEPSHGLGIDISDRMIKTAQDTYPDLNFICADVEQSSTWQINDQFDFIVLPSIIGYLEDIQNTFEGLHRYCHDETRIVICYYNFLWEPVIKLGEKINLKMPKLDQNWLSPEDIENLLYLSDFETVKVERRLLVPKKVPFVYKLLEGIGSLPLVNKLCLNQFVVARNIKSERVKDKSTTIVVPCRNEAGNVENAVKRLPSFGAHQEIIFVEGHSTDNTLDEIKRVIKTYSDKDIKYFVQDGKGKANATWMGFDNASEDILMILDGDLTVPPEDLPKFYQAIASGKGEYINGSRLVYPMEGQAMRYLNLLGNKFFSLVFSFLLNQRVKDTLCGTKVLTKEKYKALKQGRAYFGDFDPFGDFDLLFGASKLNLKFVEIPIRYRDRTYGQTNISRFRHGFILLRMTVYAFRKLKLI